ncbi:MAG: hypothetical protein JKX76_00970 [Colwellia sp.]|nr:hypothetical protein [Colwellia sp.]
MNVNKYYYLLRDHLYTKEKLLNLLGISKVNNSCFHYDKIKLVYDWLGVRTINKTLTGRLENIVIDHYLLVRQPSTFNHCEDLYNCIIKYGSTPNGIKFIDLVINDYKDMCYRLIQKLDLVDLFKKYYKLFNLEDCSKEDVTNLIISFVEHNSYKIVYWLSHTKNYNIIDNNEFDHSFECFSSNMIETLSLFPFFNNDSTFVGGPILPSQNIVNIIGAESRNFDNFEVLKKLGCLHYYSHPESLQLMGGPLYPSSYIKISDNRISKWIAIQKSKVRFNYKQFSINPYSTG